MLNNNQGGLDPSNAARTFGGQFGTGQSQTSFPLGGNLAGLHNIPASYNLQNTLPQNRGLGGLPAGGGNQQQQSRFGAQNLQGGLQQYSQVANRGGLPVMNGLNGPAVGRGVGTNPNIQGSRAQGSALGGLGGLGPNLQRQPPQGMGGLNNLGQRAMPSYGPSSGAGGHLGVQSLGSPARSTAMGLGYPGMGQAGLLNSQQPSGDLLAMINKGSQLSNLGGFNQGFGGQQQQGGSQNLGSVAASQAQGQDKEQPAFDASEFPALGGSVRGGNVGLANGDGSNKIEGATLYASLGMHKGMLPSEFNIQSEEFPALPGASVSNRPGNEERQQGEQQQQQQGQPTQSGHMNLRQDGDGPRPGQGLYDLQQAGPGQAGQQAGTTQEQLLRFYQMQGGRFPAGMKGGLGGGAPSQAQQAAQNQGGKMGVQAAQPDRFGLLGLLSVIRMTDPDLTTLALGTDLTTLGLHLNSTDNVFKTFASPWADQPLKPEPEYKVPACYRQPAPRLKPGYFSKFQQDTLFYIFYSMPADEAQVFAADELASRGWWFHKDLKAWLTRTGSDHSLQGHRLEQGSYLVFDTSLWEIVRKDNFMLNYESLERPPSLPRPGLQPANAQPNLPPK